MPAGGSQSRIAVSAAGTLAAVSEGPRIVIYAVPELTREAEISIDAEADGFEVGWVGSRLLVLSWYAAHSIVYLLDPQGPRVVAQLRLDGPMRLGAIAGSHALALGALGPVVIGVGDAQLAPYTFPTRAKPTIAGAAEALMLVALPSAIEEWDPQVRMPKRRLRLPRAVTITSLGGSHRVVWMVTSEDPQRIDVVPLVNRGQPRVHELPEKIASVSSHPRSDIVVCLGASSGRLYAVDLDGRTRMRVIALSSIERVSSAAVVVSRGTSVLVAQADRPLVLVPLDDRDPEPRAATPPPPQRATIAPVPPADARSKSTLYGEIEEAAPHVSTPLPIAPVPLPLSPAPAPAPAAPAATTAERTGPQNLSTRLSRRREELAGRAVDAQPAPAAVATAPSAPVLTPVAPAAVPVSAAAPIAIAPTPRIAVMPASARLRSWRDDLVGWLRTLGADPTAAAAPPPSAPLVDQVAEQLGLAPLVPAIARLYAGHLCGEQGAAPVEIARVLGGSWEEALGRGKLAASRVAEYFASRVHLAGAVLQVLDERPPATGTLIGVPGAVALLSPCVVVADDDELLEVAQRVLPIVGGAILVSEEDSDPDELLLEARARGAVAMLRLFGELSDLGGEPAVVVVGDEATAEELGVPRLA